jgi:hypothetical protein
MTRLSVLTAQNNKTYHSLYSLLFINPNYLINNKYTIILFSNPIDEFYVYDILFHSNERAPFNIYIFYSYHFLVFHR